MSQQTSVLREYELAKHECLLIQDTTGEYFIMAIRDIGHDIDGEPTVEIELVDNSYQRYDVVTPGGGILQIWTSKLARAKFLVDGEARSLCGLPSCTGLPRLWCLLAFLLSHRVRQDLFLPMFNELIEDYSFTKIAVRRKRERCLLAVIYTYRTIVMVSQSLLYGARTSQIPYRGLAGFLLVVEAIRRLAR